MEGDGEPVNHTHADDAHPCYQVDVVSSTLKRVSSTKCVFLYISIGCLVAVTACGNLLVIISIVYFKQLHTPTNALILSLAVADLLVGVVVFPHTMERSPKACLHTADILCKVRESFNMTLATASILNLCCISIDRYYAVCEPLTYRAKVNFHIVAAMIAVTWCTSALVAVGFLFARLKFEKCQEGCFMEMSVGKILGPFFSFYLPVVIMMGVYLKIFLVAQSQARSMYENTARKAEGKATRTLTIVMGGFLLCWMPFFLCSSVGMLGNVPVVAEVYESLVWLGMFNSILNPFIYAFFYSWFRSAFRLIIAGKIFLGDFSNSRLR